MLLLIDFLKYLDFEFVGNVDLTLPKDIDSAVHFRAAGLDLDDAFDTDHLNIDEDTDEKVVISGTIRNTALVFDISITCSLYLLFL